MPFRNQHPVNRLRAAILAVGLLIVSVTAATGPALATTPDNTHHSQAGGAKSDSLPKFDRGSRIQSPVVQDAFLRFAPGANGTCAAPPNGGSVNPGCTFVLDLIISAGTNAAPDGITAQQSYLTFTYQLIQNARVSTIGAGCTITNTLTVDPMVFEAALQNEICNGPTPCTFRGNPVDPGSIAFASGALSNCPEGCPDDIFPDTEWRIGQMGVCAQSPGAATIYWQFMPPNPPARDTQIITWSGELVQDRTRMSDYVINIIGLTSTPGPSNTPASTGTPTNTPTSTQTHTPTTTSTPTTTGTFTNTPISTRTPLGTVTPCPMTFTDVHEGDYFYEAVRYFYCAGVISGYADNTFRPYNNTTRSQLCKIVVLAMGWPIDIDGGPHFTDVLPDHPFYFFVETAYNRGIIAGYSDLTFRPYNNVTRGQLCKIIVLAMEWEVDCPPDPHFTDVPASDPFYCFIETAYARGIISGYADNTFRPANPATRGQICKIMFIALGNP